ncbi:FMN-binding negative transcriptional regulator [Acinetobacter sp. ANC 4178]|uniref:FMN-binding negative transcriptional regulator n=1 Tax=Acinetobacter sp. ANC 4178 TaxID=2529839 RepID=UPI00103D574D|nr:FMN-binding negative transcriptional regulator [Acinetobacter sp. ANC 4178]TCB68560.1 FMN-binding negative transcriptional regulator [Acinetobacter sp. ANC 4178]
MYVPAEFEETNIEVMHELIQQYPLGILLTHGQRGLDANHLPFELDAEVTELGVLHAHVARKNPVWQDVQDGDEVLVVFRAGDAYISPQWYPSKQEHHQQVPTWNYRVIHAYGKVKIRDDERYVRGVVARLTRTHEAMQAEPWKMSDAPKNYIEPMLKAIVGIEIEITKIQGKSKLGQNKEHRDVIAVAKALSDTGKQEISEAMHQVAASKKSALEVDETCRG